MKTKLSITIDRELHERTKTIYRATALEAIQSGNPIPSESNIYERIIFIGVTKENLKQPRSYWLTQAKEWLNQATMYKGRNPINRESLLKYGLISAALAYLSKQKEPTDKDLQKILMMHDLLSHPNEQSSYCND